MRTSTAKVLTRRIITGTSRAAASATLGVIPSNSGHVAEPSTQPSQLHCCRYHHGSRALAMAGRTSVIFPAVALPLLQEGRARGFSSNEVRMPEAEVTGGVVEIPLAQTGEGIADCELIQWFVKEGDMVDEFAPVCEVQSDKASVVITSRYKGQVLALKTQRLGCFPSLEWLAARRILSLFFKMARGTVFEGVVTEQGGTSALVSRSCEGCSYRHTLGR